MSEQQKIETQQLDANDIYMALNIIKTAMTRGVFKPEEYVNVGLVHDKFDSYITALKKQVEEANQQKDQDSESKE